MTNTKQITKTVLLALAFLGVVVGVERALKYATDPVVLGSHTRDKEPVTVTLGDVRLSIPKNKIRFEDQRQDGVQGRIDLYLSWPALDGYAKDNERVFNDTSEAGSLIFLSLVAEQSAGTPERRLNEIYRRFFVGKPWKGPSGLIGQELDPKSGYAGENVFYARDTDGVFVTRCLQAEAAVKNKLQPTCLFDFELVPGLIAHVRFHELILHDWRDINRRIALMLTSMRLP
ncbi:MAG: hypothetical protein AAFW47_02850 [Pseudomonadota bacterium]